jgi:hypothetical protein
VPTSALGLDDDAVVWGMTNSENCRVVALNRTELGVNEHQVWIEDLEMGAKVRRKALTGMTKTRAGYSDGEPGKDRA